MGLFTTNDFDFSNDADVNAQKAKLAEAQKNDVTRGFGLSQEALNLGTQMGERAKAPGDYGLTAGVNESAGLIGPHSQQSFQGGLGGQSDDNLNSALQKRFNKGFAREAQGIKSKAQLQAQSLKSQDLSTAQKTWAAQQQYGAANKQIQYQQDQAARAARSSVLGGILSGVGAVAGTIAAPGAGTAAGAQAGSMLGGSL